VKNISVGVFVAKCEPIIIIAKLIFEHCLKFLRKKAIFAN
jgi:hypothetical protein